MITNLQIKAARTLLEWDQSNLAKVSGLSLATITNLEQGKGHIKAVTRETVQRALEGAGIEFTPDPGVRLRREKFSQTYWEGHDSIPKVFMDIEATIGRSGGEVLLSGVDESLWIKKYRKELKEMLNRRADMNISQRLLICEGDNLVTVTPEKYRAIPKILFQQTPYYVYADKVAIINWGPPQRILLIQSSGVAETFRRQFEFNWKLGKRLDPKNVVIAGL